MLSVSVIFVVLAIQQSVSGTVITSFDTNNLQVGRAPAPGANFSRAVKTRNTLYGPWLNPTAIPYRLSTAYTPTDLQNIQSAMTAITTDMGSCIRFVPYVTGTDTGKDFLQISPTFENLTQSQTCFSFPGRLLSQTGRGQKLGMISNPVDGCLVNIRDTMKYLVHALGLRDEYNRADRNSFISINFNAVRSDLANLGLLNPFISTGVDVLTSNFDYKSITMINPTKYATNGQQLFTVLSTGVLQPSGATTTLGTLPRLSQGDCLGLKAIYSSSCASVTCNDPYNGQGASQSNVVNGVVQGTGTIGGTGVIAGISTGTGTIGGTGVIAGISTGTGTATGTNGGALEPVPGGGSAVNGGTGIINGAPGTVTGTGTGIGTGAVLPPTF